jgi:hypothetical protein
MRKTLTVGLALAMFALAAGSASAQTLGTIAGVVKDTSGAVLPGVAVEVASPALIEKTRAAVTDSAGQYAIINLPVGTYDVTFTLQGFSSVKRDGVGVLANFTAAVNAELQVGAVAETVTVTGESPLIDVQGTVTSRAVTPEVIKAIPNGGTMYQLAAMMPGVTISGGQDVGGSSGSPVGAQLSAHGGTGNDEVQLLDGLRVGNMMGGSRTQQTLSPLLYDEVDVQISGQGGDAVSLGVTSNSIPRSGGNTFSGTLLTNGSAPSLQASNLTDRLKSLGLTSSATLKALYDLNGSLGGPIKKDRLWFYVTGRYQTNQTYAPGAYFTTSNTYPTPPNLLRATDLSNQAYNPQYIWDSTYRVTAAVNQKLRVNGFADVQHKWWPYFPGVTAATAPESQGQVDWPGRIYQASATYAATNRLLFEAGWNYQDSRDTIYPRGNPDGTIPSPNNTNGPINAVRVAEQGATLANGTVLSPMTYGPYGAALIDNPMAMQDYRAVMNYVTGSHSFKLGMDVQHGYRERVGTNFSNDIQYRTLGGNLNQVTIFAPQGHYRTTLDYDTGIFVQDRWTHKQLTLNGALRLDVQKESYSPYTVTPTKYTPNRPVSTTPGADVVNWKDLNPRFGAAYDLFGNGRTAVKVSAARGVAGETIATADAVNPGVAFATSTAINVTDNNRNGVADCNLLNPLANGECLGWVTPGFGGTIPLTKQDPATLDGYNVRPWNWEFSAGVQHQLSPRLSAGITYYRRINGGFLVTDNTANAAVDFSAFNLTVPTDPRLPTSGQSLTYFDIKPGLTSKGVSSLSTANVITFASNYGEQFQHWNGVDLTGSSRLFAGVTATGGITFGQQMTDNCDVVKQLPEVLTTPIAGLSAQQYCHFETGWAPQYKMLASYQLPWQGIRVSGNFQSLPGPVRQAAVLYSQAQVTAALGRPATVAGNKTALVIEPFSAAGLSGTTFGDRLNQLDLRFSKIFKLGKSSLDANFDIYNTFNSDAVLTETAGYSGANGGAWLLPTSVLQARIIKFGVRWDF